MIILKKWKHIFRDAFFGGLIGIGIGFTLSILYDGLSGNSWLGDALFGLVGGFTVTVTCETIAVALKSWFHWFRFLAIPVFIFLCLTYFLSSAIFYGITMLFHNFGCAIDQQVGIMQMSLGSGLVSTMVALFFILVEINKEKLELEKENRQLAVIEERNRIARELHDSVSQNLFGINLNLNTLSLLVKQEPEKALTIIRQLQEMIQEVQSEMRLMIYELKPAAIMEKGFFEAMENLIGLFRARYALEIDCHLTGDEEMIDVNRQIILYRILQESLNNVVKHASANVVKVNLRINNSSSELIIEDNGRGFDTKCVVTNHHLGLSLMKERVKQVDGKFTVNSAPGKGTAIAVVL